MNMKNLSIAAAVFGFAMGSAALAADPIKLNCPAGSAQKLVAQQDLACLKADGSRAAGPVVMLYPSGKKMAEGQVSEGGFRTGTWTLFDEKGVKTHVIEFNRGNFDGKWVEFYPTGVQKTVQQYKAGLRVGEPQQFDAAGKLVVTAAK